MQDNGDDDFTQHGGHHIETRTPARQRLASEAPCLRKFDNPWISKILVVT